MEARQSGYILRFLVGKIDKHIEKRSGQVDNMLSSMDRTLSDGRQLDFLFEQMMLQRTIQNHQNPSSFREGTGRMYGESGSSESKGYNESKWSEDKMSLLGGDSDVNWTGKTLKAESAMVMCLLRCIRDCSSERACGLCYLYVNCDLQHHQCHGKWKEKHYPELLACLS